ncbi:hypothetical protein [Winogradskyella sp.]|uniref:DUF7486 family protein n=1 Tax=Winogradskyella sp. TaxID=1883156 RepID=UPI00260B37A5|nr:hypothetical protein [Winogradskyella sp.]
MIRSIKTLKATPIMAFVFIIIFGKAQINAQELGIDKTNTHKPETELPPDVLWDVKAYMPEAKLIKVKAVDKAGNLYAIKGLQTYDDTSLLDIKCLYNEAVLPVKLVISDNSYALKAIKKDGSVLDVKAITDNGEQFSIQGIQRTGNTVSIRVMGKDNKTFKVFAISPEGNVNDVKGIKMLRDNIETVVNGVKVYAHVKALHQE